ncbi:hypothetical protein B0A48_04286 [Cryoendolithus antarcticus]|uniref:NAD(P)-binding protein n=1 Tax=Cryoendolithus antarcticus TaxID=1507870 RepID=A0A1V8TFB1_9PEZI|nr:hypothetical protein B0A48_04286 [Cryoendolithus antarcticus]
MAPIMLVTGGNRGIGLSIVRGLAERAPDGTIIVASRQGSAAEGAIATLQQEGVKATFHALSLDVTNDESIRTAVQEVNSVFGHLDVLVNNAGIGLNPSADYSDFRHTYNKVFDTNITSVALLSHLFMPLLLKSNNPKIINLSSGRASVHALTTGTLPPTASVSYSVSKTALNVLTLEMAKQFPDVAFYAATPGHCSTALNAFKGKRDPGEGAGVIVELAVADKGKYGLGFWERVDGEMREVAW